VSIPEGLFAANFSASTIVFNGIALLWRSCLRRGDHASVPVNRLQQLRAVTFSRAIVFHYAPGDYICCVGIARNALTFAQRIEYLLKHGKLIRPDNLAILE
jgi:hypothetical protein